MRFFWGIAILLLDILRAALIDKSAPTATTVTHNHLHEAVGGSYIQAGTINGDVHIRGGEHEQQCRNCGDEQTPRRPPTATDQAAG